MGPKRLLKLLGLLCAFTLVVTACGDDDDEGVGEDAGATDDGGSDEGAQRSGLLSDDGPCDESLDPYRVGTVTVLESAVMSLGDDVTALEASIVAFNERGGIGGHCMELTACDSEADPNKEVACVRDFVNGDIVATLSGNTPFNPEASTTLFEQAGMPRVLLSPQTAASDSPVTYAIGAGGSGTTFMMVPSCARNGHTQIAAIHVDAPQIAALFAALQPMLDAYGAELVAKIPVPAGTTDFQQFTLAAQEDGATCIIIPLGEAEAISVLQAAQQLGTELTFAGSTNTFGKADIEEFGDLAGQLYLNAAIPPVLADQERWPILADVIADLEASGRPEMQAEEIDTGSMRSWVAVYALKTIVEEFGTPDDISREAITAALDAATDVDMFDLVPPWTPSNSVLPDSPFSAVSQPWYYVSTFDVEAGEWVVSDDQYHVVNELIGQIEYNQPDPAAGGEASGQADDTTAETTEGG